MLAVKEKKRRLHTARATYVHMFVILYVYNHVYIYTNMHTHIQNVCMYLRTDTNMFAHAANLGDLKLTVVSVETQKASSTSTTRWPTGNTRDSRAMYST